MYFVKTLTVVRIIPALDSMILSRTFVGTGKNLDDADLACIQNIHMNWDDIRSIAPGHLEPDDIVNSQSVAELVSLINRKWLNTSASQYGFALKDA